MTLTIGDYKVKIIAEHPFCEDKEESTLHFLNEMSVAYSEASRQLQADGYSGLARTADRKAWEIYTAVKKRGFYDKEDESESA